MGINIHSNGKAEKAPSFHLRTANKEQTMQKHKNHRPNTRSKAKKPFRPTNYVKSVRGSAHWQLREDQKTQNLSPERLALVKEAIRVHNERADQERFHLLPPIHKLKAELQARRETAITKIIHDHYRVSKSRWVGGKTFIQVETGESPHASGYSTVEWEHNRIWSGTNAHLSVTIQITWLSRIAAVPGLATAGGKLTTHAVQIKPDVWKASWVEQGRGFELRAVSGYIVLVEGQFFHGKNEGAARRSAKRAIARQRAADLEAARLTVRRLLENDQPVPPDLLNEFPELARDVMAIKRELRRKQLEWDVRRGVPVDLDELAEYPDVLSLYQKIQRDSILTRLNRGEKVPLDELVMFPDLIVEYGD